MGRIIRLHGDQHEETQKLLPWYVAGQLDPIDLANVEAHLADCADCCAELQSERRLKAEVSSLPLDVEMGWAKLRHRLDLVPKQRLIEEVGLFGLRRVLWPRLGWFLAGQAALVMLVAILVSPLGNPAPYQALGTAGIQRDGNVIVIFRPETSERALRHILNASHARLVDGPTASDAYLLHVPPSERAFLLARLRAQSAIVLAEPIDTGVQP